jgi:hypothetical protein
MRFPYHPVDASFFDDAPMRFKNEVELSARPAEIFSILADASTWPHWFGAMHKAVWTSAKAGGVGSTRTASLTMLTVDEQFFRWEQNRRFSFYLTSQSMPLTHAMAEDYPLEEVGTATARFTYSVAMEPRGLRWQWVARTHFGSMFKEAREGLKRYVASSPTIH